MELWESKLCAILLLGLGSIICGLLPGFFSRRRQQWPLLMSCLLCFGGGVLLATSVVHILPEVRELFPRDYKPYAELVFCLGFFVLYILDEIVHLCYGEVDETSYLSHAARRHSAVVNDNTVPHSRSPSYGSLEAVSEPPGYTETQLPYNPDFYQAKCETDGLMDNQVPSQMCHVGHQEPCSNTLPIANVGLLVALSVHALLEGLVIGLESKPSKVLLLLAAVASHKLVVGFCLGVELISSPFNTFCKHFTSIVIFSLGSVAGIAVGMVVSNIPTTVNTLVTPLLQGLAGGTLLYVTLSEVLPRERARWHQQHSRKSAGLCQFFSVCLGFAVMVVLTNYTE